MVHFIGPDENGKDKLQHRSFVVVSDEMSHSATTVHGILNKIIPLLKEIDPEVTFIHYWTDGPTSQYRNKQIFYTVANHTNIYDIGARWNYFEAGHGKGPCDGLGGTTKIMADEAIRSVRVVIQDPKDFYNWAINSSLKGIKFLFVSSDDCQRAGIILEARSVIPLKGTFKLHAVVGLGEDKVAFNEVSCYCQICVKGKDVCEDWKTHSLAANGKSKSDKKDTTDDSVAIVHNTVTTDPSASDVETLTQSGLLRDVQIGDYVAAVYEGDWYIGKVQQIDEVDNEIEVKFMKKKSDDIFQWPKDDDEDVLWIAPKKFICKVKEPIPAGKSERMKKRLKLDGDDRKKVEETFEGMK